MASAQRGISAEKKKIFAEKRLGALQGGVQLCDFISANNDKSLDLDLATDWQRIRREVLANGGLLPHDVQQAFQRVVFSVDESYGSLTADLAAAQELRRLCLQAIHREFESD